MLRRYRRRNLHVELIRRVKGMRGRPLDGNVTHRSQRVELALTGGIVDVSNGFEIEYRVAGRNAVCWIIKQASAVDQEVHVTVLQSASGTGKTTLLRELFRHLAEGKPTPLRLHVAPEPRDEWRYICGYVPQNPLFVKHWLCRDLVAVRSPFLSAVFGDLDDNLITDMMHRRLGELAGGQIRRMFACSVLDRLASLATGAPSILLLDETFDGIGLEGLVRCIRRIRNEWSAICDAVLNILVVTHLPHDELVRKLPDKSVFMTIQVKERMPSRMVVELGNL